MESRSFFSRGKILISGEYAVLFGAKALAVPTRWGQYLQASDTGCPGRIFIRSLLNDQVWFTGKLSFPDFNVIETSDDQACAFLKSVLQAANELKPGFLDEAKGYELVARLEFDTRWGLGSSSSLISNLAWWTGLDPYQLFWKVSSGSGYDIACARAVNPLVYQLKDSTPVVQEVDFAPPFRDKLFFVYLGNKQDSQYSVREFRSNFFPDQQVIEAVSGLTMQIIRAQDLEQFSGLITRHEECLSAYLKVPAVKKLRFPGFPGPMKSLGAWGGDMVLVAWEREEEELRKYFESKGLKLIFRYDDLI